MATPDQITIVKLQFKGRTDFDLTDIEIGVILDATGSVIDACIMIADMYASRFAGNSSKLTVGPITIDDSNAAGDWMELKKNFIIRKNQGAGVPGAGGWSPMLGVGGASLGCTTPSEFYTGQFDNPRRVGCCDE